MVYTQTANAGKNVTIKGMHDRLEFDSQGQFWFSLHTIFYINDFLTGKYRYCAHCECPGCLKSLWMRVFGQEILVAAYFAYDCQYHDFEVNVTASIVPGRHKIYVS